jgi:hypothetical protein
MSDFFLPALLKPGVFFRALRYCYILKTTDPDELKSSLRRYVPPEDVSAVDEVEDVEDFVNLIESVRNRVSYERDVSERQ